MVRASPSNMARQVNSFISIFSGTKGLNFSGVLLTGRSVAMKSYPSARLVKVGAKCEYSKSAKVITRTCQFTSGTAGFVTGGLVSCVGREDNLTLAPRCVHCDYAAIL